MRVSSALMMAQVYTLFAEAPLSFGEDQNPPKMGSKSPSPIRHRGQQRRQRQTVCRFVAAKVHSEFTRLYVARRVEVKRKGGARYAMHES